MVRRKNKNTAPERACTSNCQMLRYIFKLAQRDISLLKLSLRWPYTSS